MTKMEKEKVQELLKYKEELEELISILAIDNPSEHYNRGFVMGKKALLPLLKEIEWKGGGSYSPGDIWCPYCGGGAVTHQTSCELERTIKELEL